MLPSCGAFDLVYKVVLFRHALCMQIFYAMVFQRVFSFFFFFSVGGGGGRWGAMENFPKSRTGNDGDWGRGHKKVSEKCDVFIFSLNVT